MSWIDRMLECIKDLPMLWALFNEHSIVDDNLRWRQQVVSMYQISSGSFYSRSGCFDMPPCTERFVHVLMKGWTVCRFCSPEFEESPCAFLRLFKCAHRVSVYQTRTNTYWLKSIIFTQYVGRILLDRAHVQRISDKSWWTLSEPFQCAVDTWYLRSRIYPYLALAIDSRPSKGGMNIFYSCKNARSLRFTSLKSFDPAVRVSWWCDAYQIYVSDSWWPDWSCRG